jgi:NAD(P)-dependent dehydrogenase (short-subunit alcohol dehydrogenase family)
LGIEYRLRSPQNAAVLITGAGRGIGKRLAIGFAHAGARVGLLGRNEAELDVTKLEIEHAKGAALRLRADVCDFEQVCAAVERMTGTWGGVNALIANAGVQGPIGPFSEQKPRQWREVFDTNVLGVMNSCRAVLPHMLQRRSGKIIVISGTGAANARPNFAPYAAGEAALVRFVETVAEEIRDRNVQINSIFPGEANTSMTDEILSAGAAAGPEEVELAERVRLTGGTAPEKQIQLALFLASERSNHVTGKLIYVQDDWKRLETENGRRDAFTLRRHLK